MLAARLRRVLPALLVAVMMLALMGGGAQASSRLGDVTLSAAHEAPGYSPAYTLSFTPLTALAEGALINLRFSNTFGLAGDLDGLELLSDGAGVTATAGVEGNQLTLTLGPGAALLAGRPVQIRIPAGVITNPTAAGPQSMALITYRSIRFGADYGSALMSSKLSVRWHLGPAGNTAGVRTPITIRLVDTFGVSRPLRAAVPLRLTSMSSSGAFYTEPEGGTPTRTLTVEPGTNAVTAYYADSNPGSHVVVVTSPGGTALPYVFNVQIRAAE